MFISVFGFCCPSYSEHFRLVSYNILADYCAINHQPELYFHISPEDLDWEWRRHNILSEIQFWSPDILCLQVCLVTQPIPISSCHLYAHRYNDHTLID